MKLSQNMECKRHGFQKYVFIQGSTYQCTKCRSEQVQRRRKKLKKILVEEAGGCCVGCGYNRCIWVLEFHHRDSSTKSFNISYYTYGLARMRKEAAKCDLLCANCHREIEFRSWVAKLAAAPDC